MMQDSTASIIDVANHQPAPVAREPAGDPRPVVNGATPAATAAAPLPSADGAALARFAESGLRALLLVNGLAAAAVLALLADAPKAVAVLAAPSLNCFAWGAGLGAVATVAAYLAHMLFTDPTCAYERRAYGHSLRIAALTAGLIGVGAFMYGVTLVARAFA